MRGGIEESVDVKSVDESSNSTLGKSNGCLGGQ